MAVVNNDKILKETIVSNSFGTKLYIKEISSYSMWVVCGDKVEARLFDNYQQALDYSCDIIDIDAEYGDYVNC